MIVTIETKKTDERCLNLLLNEKEEQKHKELYINYCEEGLSYKEAFDKATEDTLKGSGDKWVMNLESLQDF